MFTRAFDDKLAFRIERTTFFRYGNLFLTRQILPGDAVRIFCYFVWFADSHNLTAMFTGTWGLKP